MPVSLSPEKTVPIYLDGDLLDQPDKEKCPVFHCRFLTCNDVIKLDELLAQAIGEADNKKSVALLNQALDIGIVRWDRMGRDIEKEEMYGGVLTPSEKWELVAKMQREVQLAEIDRKNSGLARRLKPADAAPNVPTPAAA